jgi:hypothetical protein
VDEVDEMDEVFEDMLALFPTITGASASPGPAIEEFMTVLLDSGDMADEPELEEIFVHPMLCANTFAEVAEELGIHPDALDELSTEEREDAYLTILEGTAQRLLTDELRQEILNGLNDLRLRLKRSGEREEAAKAAALQSFMGEYVGNELWPTTGLVQAIFYRSTQIGFALIEASTEVMETFDPDEGGPLLLDEVARSKIAQKTDALIKEVPGLGGFLEKQADKIWEEGVEAVFKGKLYLELFSPEELEGAAEIFETTFGRFDPDDTTDTPEPVVPRVPEEAVVTGISQLDDYVEKLFTPERLDQLRARLDAVLKDPAFAGKWKPFLLQLAESMKHEDAIEYEKPFLVQALLGEIAFFIGALQEDEP